jgi:hypothetical protein
MLKTVVNIIIETAIEIVKSSNGDNNRDSEI